ncbi:MAG: alanine racemase [Microlunatus sp.]
MGPYIDSSTASAVIDLDAFAANIETLRAHVVPAAVMVVVKADAYGHGLVECARVAREAGADWLGVATPGEALALRAAGDRGPLLAWLYGPREDLGPLIAAEVDVSAQSVEQLARIADAAQAAGRTARVHLKIDTGLSRNGATAADWPAVCAAARHAEQRGAVQVVGIWSHLACADEPGAESVDAQRQVFETAYRLAREAGLTPAIRHLANSAGAMIWPETRYELVRVGIAAYGVEPDVGIAELAGISLRPVMRLRAELANVKTVETGTGVSYGHTWQAPAPTSLGLVPLGYGDGIPRQAGNLAEVGWRGRRAPIRGRVCMDQFVVELGEAQPAAEVAEIGEEVTVFGPGDQGEPTVAEWAAWCGTIGYEIVTRIGSRVPRVYARRSAMEGEGG